MSKKSCLLNEQMNSSNKTCLNCFNLKLKPFQINGNNVTIDFNSKSIVRCVKDDMKEFNCDSDEQMWKGKDSKPLEGFLKLPERYIRIASNCSDYDPEPEIGSSFI